MNIGGFVKNTLIDYPGKMSCIIFTQGCSFRCPFCQNKELVDVPDDAESIKESYIFSFLKKRKGLLDAVVITGGEPTLQKDLPDFIRKVRELGFLIKLDTNGWAPEILERLLKENLIDFVAMDIKASKDNYEKAAGVKVNIYNIEKSIRLIRSSGLPYEFRTTVVPGIHDKDDIRKMAQWIEGSNLFLQKFVPQNTLDPEYEKKNPFTNKEMEEMKKIAGQFVNCGLRA
ncbi:MAG: anaerobic ribonucleoside-triphosphate reductase activating protein [Candidatus Aenigmarchaeota archaeon]|nr:anaerobic ribonucleoside-triphosphate reductase activating protein [Candidatus Aenigmarchaeota archaeon]